MHSLSHSEKSLFTQIIETANSLTKDIQDFIASQNRQHEAFLRSFPALQTKVHHTLHSSHSNFIVLPSAPEQRDIVPPIPIPNLSTIVSYGSENPCGTVSTSPPLHAIAISSSGSKLYFASIFLAPDMVRSSYFGFEMFALTAKVSSPQKMAVNKIPATTLQYPIPVFDPGGTPVCKLSRCFSVVCIKWGDNVAVLSFNVAIEPLRAQFVVTETTLQIYGHFSDCGLSESSKFSIFGSLSDGHPMFVEMPHCTVVDAPIPDTEPHGPGPLKSPSSIVATYLPSLPKLDIISIHAFVARNSWVFKHGVPLLLKGEGKFIVEDKLLMVTDVMNSLDSDTHDPILTLGEHGSCYFDLEVSFESAFPYFDLEDKISLGDVGNDTNGPLVQDSGPSEASSRPKNYVK